MGSQIPNTLKMLRKEKGLKQEEVASEIGVTTKTYRTWEKDFDRMKSGIKSNNLIALSNLYDVSVDYLLGMSTCRGVDNDYIWKKIGLNDGAINALEMIKLQDSNEMMDDRYFKADKRLSLIDVMNFTIQNSLENVLMSIRDFISVRYKIPVFFDENNKKWICPKSDYEYTKGTNITDEMWWLNLASNPATPYDNKSMVLSDTFFETVALKAVEKEIYLLRDLYYEINKRER